jgi:hypothetical protein
MKRPLLIAGFTVAIVTSGACGLAPLDGRLATTPPSWVHGHGRVYGSFAEANRECAKVGFWVVGFRRGREYGWACTPPPAAPAAAPPADKPQGSK